MKKYIILIWLAIVIAGLSFIKTQSYFSDTETIASNRFSTSDEFYTPTPKIIFDHIVINEVFSGSNQLGEWVELYNQTSNPINLNNWTISDKISSDILITSVSLASGQYAVIIPNDYSGPAIPSTALEIRLSTNAIGNGLNNNNEAVTLRDNSSTVIDQVGYGEDGGIFNPQLANPPSGSSAARIPNITDTNTAADWVIDSTPSIGITN